MNIKLLIGLYIFGIASAGAVSSKPTNKRSAKASPQFDYASGSPLTYDPVNNFASYGQQSYAAQPSLSPYNVGSAAQSNGYSNAFASGNSPVPVFVNQNLYQRSSVGGYQLIPIPVAYSAGGVYGSNSAQVSASGYVNNGYSQIYPQNLNGLTGTPAPALAGSQPVYDSVASTPPQTVNRDYFARNYPTPASSSALYYFGNAPIAGNYPIPTSTPAPYLAQQPIPVPVKVSSRNSFQQVSSYPSASLGLAYHTASPAQNYPSTSHVQNYPFPFSTPAPYSSNFQPIPVPIAAPQQQQYTSQVSQQYNYPIQSQATHQQQYSYQVRPQVVYQEQYPVQPQVTQPVSTYSVSPIATYAGGPVLSKSTSIPSTTAATFTKTDQENQSLIPTKYISTTPATVTVTPHSERSQFTTASVSPQYYPSLLISSTPKPYGALKNSYSQTVISSTSRPNDYSQGVVSSTPRPNDYSQGVVSTTPRPFGANFYSQGAVYSPPQPFGANVYSQGANAYPQGFVFYSPQPLGANAYSQSVANPSYGNSLQYTPVQSGAYSPSTAVSHVSYKGLGANYSY